MSYFVSIQNSMRVKKYILLFIFQAAVDKCLTYNEVNDFNPAKASLAMILIALLLTSLEMKKNSFKNQQ